MSEQYDADLIERIRVDLERLPSREMPSPVPAMTRGRRRKRLAFVRTSVLAVLLAVAVVVPLVQLSGLRGNRGPEPISPQRPSPSHPEFFHDQGGSPPLQGERRCPTYSSPPFSKSVKPRHAAPGARIFVAGLTPVFSESGKYVGPRGRIGFWFNLPANGWARAYSDIPTPSTNNGAPVVHLGEASVQGNCTYQVTFTIPDMPEGVYGLVLIEHGSGSSAALGKPVYIRVTSPNPSSAGPLHFDPGYTPVSQLPSEVLPAYPSGGVLTPDPGTNRYTRAVAEVTYPAPSSTQPLSIIRVDGNIALLRQGNKLLTFDLGTRRYGIA